MPQRNDVQFFFFFWGGRHNYGFDFLLSCQLNFLNFKFCAVEDMIASNWQTINKSVNNLLKF